MHQLNLETIRFSITRLKQDQRDGLISDAAQIALKR